MVSIWLAREGKGQVLDKIKVRDTTAHGTVQARAIGSVHQVPALVDDAAQIGKLWHTDARRGERGGQ